MESRHNYLEILREANLRDFSPLEALLRRISNFLIIRWIIRDLVDYCKNSGYLFLASDCLPVRETDRHHGFQNNTHWYETYQYVYTFPLAERDHRLAITPSWLFNVSLARANTLEKFRCLVITLPVALYRIIRTFVHSVWIIFARRNC